MLPPAVLAVDPGGMTGLALYRTEPAFSSTPVLPADFQCTELDFMAACGKIDYLTRDYGNRLAIFWERFTVTRDTHKRTPQPDAMHVIGVCRYLAAKHGCRVLPEAQQASPSAPEQEKLKALGWWRAGEDDSQSAAAHMLRWLVASDELPPKEREILAALEKGERQWSGLRKFALRSSSPTRSSRRWTTGSSNA